MVIQRPSRTKIPILSSHLTPNPYLPLRSTPARPSILRTTLHPLPSHSSQSSVTNTSHSTPASLTPCAVVRAGSSDLSYFHTGVSDVGKAGDQAGRESWMNVNSDAPVWRGYEVKWIVTASDQCSIPVRLASSSLRGKRHTVVGVTDLYIL